MLNHQLASPQFSDPSEVVSHFVAMQAQEYRLMRWAVAMRTKRPSSRAFEQAYNSGSIVRLHLLRGTWQLVAAEDYAWLISLCADKARRVINGWMSANKISIPDEEYARIGDIFCQTAADKGSVTKDDFLEALVERDIHMDEHRVSYHIRMLELSGRLCSGDLLPMKATYSLTSSKINSMESIPREEALALLAQRYFISRGAATLEDFVWWSGLNVGDCRKGLSLLGNKIHTEHFGGRDYHIHQDCRSRGRVVGSVVLLPPYDEYLISYKSRDLVLSPEHRHHAHNNSGIFKPVVLQNGVVCGNWSPFSNEPSATYFLDTKPDTDAPWQVYRRFLSDSLTNISVPK